jgi:hypothetical protein
MMKLSLAQNSSMYSPVTPADPGAPIDTQRDLDLVKMYSANGAFLHVAEQLRDLLLSVSELSAKAVELDLRRSCGQRGEGAAERIFLERLVDGFYV